MATINASSFIYGVDISPSSSALPKVVVDQGGIEYGEYEIRANAVLEEIDSPYEFEVILHGTFDITSEETAGSSTLTSVSLASSKAGTFSVQGLNLKVRDVTDDSIAAAVKILQGSDTIIGTAQGDAIDGYFGDDLIRGGRGDDLIWGGSGNDRLYGNGGQNNLNGGPGFDSFYTKANPGRSIQIVQDYAVGEDTLYIRGDLSLVTTRDTSGGLAFYQNDSESPFAILSGIGSSDLAGITLKAWP